MNTTLSYYEKNASKLAKRYELANVTTLQQRLLESFLPHQHLLELGCGSGRDASFMYENGYNIIAIDGSKKMIEEAKKRHPRLSHYLFTLQLPHGLHFTDASFEGIYSIATLMHLSKDEIIQTLQKIYRLLKKEGKLLFSVSIQRDDTDQKGQDIHQRLFTSLSKEEWIRLCIKEGFTLLHTEVTNDGLGRGGIIWLTCIVEKP